MPHRSDEGGFLLLEVLVAFVIAALALAVLFEGAVGGLRATALAGRYDQAIARARSHLAAVGGRASWLAPGVQAGDDGSGFRWQVRVVPVAATVLAAPPTRRLILYRVSVTESWKAEGAQRDVRLTTARLQQEAWAGP